MFAYDFVFRIMFWYVGSLLIFISSYFSSVFGFFITRYHGVEGDKKLVVDVKQAQDDDNLCSSFSKEESNNDDDLGFESHDEETKTECSVFVETMATTTTSGIQPELQARRIHVADEENEDFAETSDFTDEKTRDFAMRDHSDKLQSEIPLFSFKFVLSPIRPNADKLIEEHHDIDSTEDDHVEISGGSRIFGGALAHCAPQVHPPLVEMVTTNIEPDKTEDLAHDDEIEQTIMEQVQSIFDITDKDHEGLDQEGGENPSLIENRSSETTISDSDSESFIELEPETGFFNERVFAHLNIARLDEEQESMDDDSDQFHELDLHGEESETFDDYSEIPQEPKLHKEESSSRNSDFDFEKPHEPNLREEEPRTKDDASGKPQEPSLHDQESDLSDSDSEDEMEHQVYINQLKQELKYVKTRGLPTILEDLESPKVLDDLKPLRIDTKMEHKERIQEIQKVYKIYADKMRKLDVLSYQTMQSIDLLRLKITPAQSNSSKKSSLTPLKSLISFKQSKTRNSGENTTERSIKDLQKDYELVYTGQICISWEILHWQHKKAKELQRYDPHGFKQYNHAASEFQQFQVLLQRFIENEPFQETDRIQNYIANRSIFRSFLQVPSLRDDSMKDKKVRQEEKYMINIAMLTGIIGESKRLFFEFIRSGKESYSTRDANGAFDILEDHVDSELLIDVLENFQKKEKRVKELLRARSCIAKKFRKNQDEEKLDHSLLNAQVELKLVEKVINMSKLTREQLIWCHTKLEDINFLSRKICLEPTNFLLFLPF